MPTKATARVTIKLEVNLSRPWPKEATVEEIQKRAKEEAMNLVSKHITSIQSFKMIQETHVDVIIVSEE